MTRSSVVSRSRLVVVALAVALAAALLTGVAWQIANPRRGAKPASAAVGVTINMKVTGHKQGVFKGDDNASAKLDGLITVTGYQSTSSRRATPPQDCRRVGGRSSRWSSLM